MELLEIFKTLVKIPSPSMKEDKVAEKIIEILDNAGINAWQDDFGNVYAKIEGDKDKAGLLLSAHMDVVGDDRPVNIIEKDGFIETDKTRTLGADDKAGVAAIIKLLLDIKQNSNKPDSGIFGKRDFGTIEAVFTRDEENSMSGIHNVEFDQLNSEYILVLDSDKLGNFEVSGAGYLKLTVSIKTPFGGHSGLDISDSKRLNAAKLISEIVSKIPQGVYKFDNNTKNVVTSINIGAIAAGGLENSMYQAVNKGLKGEAAVEFMAENSMSNIINTSAVAHYSIRSSDNKAQEELISEIKEIINNFNERYGEIKEEGLNLPALAHAEIKIEEHLPVFEKSNDEFLINIAKNAAKKADINLKVSSFHAGAETHIYANRKNIIGKNFKPVLMGIADVFNMHSSDEKINIQSYKKGYEFLKEFLKEL